MDVIDKLRGGNLRSIGKSNQVVADVLKHPGLFAKVFHGMMVEDPVVRMRCADAAEKITVRHPEWLQPHKSELLWKVSKVDQKEVRWHVAQMIPRLKLNPTERFGAVQILLGYLDDDCRILKTFAMQALADLAERDNRFLPTVVPLLRMLTRTGSPAMRSRGHKLLRELEHPDARGKRG